MFSATLRLLAQGLPAANVLDEPDVAFAQGLALVIFLMLQFFAHHSDVLIGISLAGDALKL